MQLDIKQTFISGFIIINCGSGGDSRKRTNPNMLTVTFVSIINIIVPKKMQGISPPKEKLGIWVGFARRTKKTHHHALTRRL